MSKAQYTLPVFTVDVFDIREHELWSRAPVHTTHVQFTAHVHVP